MTTPKDKLIAHLIELIQRPTARFFRVSPGNLSLCGQIGERAELEGGVILKRTLYGNETQSSPSQEIEIDANGLLITIKSRDLALEWIEARNAAEIRIAEKLRKQQEDFEEKQAEAMLKALGIQ